MSNTARKYNKDVRGLCPAQRSVIREFKMNRTINENRNKVQQDVEAFLASGGEINKIPTGHGTDFIKRGRRSSTGGRGIIYGKEKYKEVF